VISHDGPKSPRRRGDAEAVDPSGGAAVAGRFFAASKTVCFFPLENHGKMVEHHKETPESRGNFKVVLHF